MKDLTQGSIGRHLIAMSLFIGAGMIVQTLYFLVDLYFVASLGATVLAGVSAAGNVMFVIIALTQIVAVGAVTLIAQAVGRKDHATANLVFNHALSFAALCLTATTIAGYALAAPYMRAISQDAATIAVGTTYLVWFVPGLALQFVTVTLGASLRGTGVVRPAAITQIGTVALNILLAPVLIAGWGTGHPLGAAGAALASTVSVALGTVFLTLYFVMYERYLELDWRLWRPRRAIWSRMLDIGLPAGGEFSAIFINQAVIYACIQSFGPAAQAGYGVGARVMQAVFVPVFAIAFAASPIAAQNFGARQADRVRATFAGAASLGVIIMAILTLLCQWRPALLVGFFVDDPAVLAIGTDYLRIMSWNFVGLALTFTCAGLFRALGNTWPALMSSALRLVIFVAPAWWLAARPDTRIEHFWYLSVAAIALQALFSLWLLRREFAKRLAFPPVVSAAPIGSNDRSADLAAG
jgi:putative MATE family efflux protein